MRKWICVVVAILLSGFSSFGQEVKVVPEDWLRIAAFRSSANVFRAYDESDVGRNDSLNFGFSPIMYLQTLSNLELGASGEVSLEIQSAAGCSKEQLHALPRILADVERNSRSKAASLDGELEENGGYGLKFIKVGAELRRVSIVAGDLLFEVDGSSVRSLEDLRRVMRASKGDVRLAGYHKANGRIFDDVVVKTVDGSAGYDSQPIFSNSNALLVNEKLRNSSSKFLIDIGSQPNSIGLISKFDANYLTSPELLNFFRGRVSQDFSFDSSFKRPDSSIQLLSVFDLNALWQQRFQDEPEHLDFHTPKGRQKISFLVKRSGIFEYGAGNKFQAIRMPLKDTSISVVCIIPSVGVDPLSAYELSFRTQWAKALMDIKIPKCKFQTNLELAPFLKSLGLPSVAATNGAIFSQIDPEIPIQIDSMVQQSSVVMEPTGIQVRVEGSTVLRALGVNGASELQFIADRPFLLTIETATRIPLFVAWVSQPRLEKE